MKSMPRVPHARRPAATPRIAAALGALLGAVPAGGCAGAPEADLLIRGARVWTADAERPWAEAVAVRGDRIVWVGSDAEAAGRFAGPKQVLDAGGRLLLPGFIDSHSHIGLGTDPDMLWLGEARSLEDLRARVREFARQRPDLPWIEGEGWNYGALPGGRLPRASDLEGLTGGRPAFLVAYDAHTVWVNREALRALGIARGAVRVPFAEVEFDPRTGEPTGILTGLSTLALGSGAQEELARHLPSYSAERRYKRLRDGLATASRFGITTIVEPQSSLEDLELYARVRAEGGLTSRLQVAFFHPRGLPESDLQKFDQARRRFDDDWLRLAAVKLYIDDVIEPHTAAMLEPYADRPGEKGDTLYPPEEFAEVVGRLDRRGYQMFIHAIGDRGIRVALDALERARADNEARDSRHQLVHVECLSPRDVPRFKALGVVACMQPRHCAPDISGRWAEAVGPARSRQAWAFRSLRDAGAVLAFASDWNVAEMDPLVGIYTALTRRGLDGRPEAGWIPEQTVDLETALRAYTIQGAYANFLESSRGSISPGKYADLVLLSDDLFALPPERLRQARVLLTLVGGRETHRAL